MASKRNVRSYQQEDDVAVEKHRKSRSASQSDDPKQRERSSTSLSSATSRESSTTAETKVEMTLDGDQVVMAIETKTTKAIKDADSKPASGRSMWATVSDMPKTEPTPFTFAHSEKVAPLAKDGMPANFGVVVPGVYRSSYPTKDNYGYIQRLGLKTIVTLGRKDEPDVPYVDFLAANSINHHIIEMKGTKKESIPLRTMKDILRVVLDQQCHPLMIHCNHGKHRTGCVVGVVRKVSGWKLDTILDEYKAYAEPKVRECDLEYITGFEVSQLSNVVVHEVNMRFRTRAFFRSAAFAFAVLVIWTISGQQMTHSPSS